MTTVDIPHRPAFRAQEVCELAGVQPYVLRTWEAEFPDLGVAKTAGGARVYRRADVERVLRIKQLLFDEGLTLAGVRRRLGEEAAAATPTESSPEAELFAAMDGEARARLREVRQGLASILGLLSRGPAPDFALEAPTPAVAHATATNGKAARSSHRAAASRKR